MKIFFLSLLLFVSGILFGQRKIVPVFGLEGGALSGGLSDQNGYRYSTDFNGSFWIDLIGINKKGNPSAGLKFKGTYNSYNMPYVESFVNPPPDIAIRETAVSVLLKLCLASKTTYFSQKEGDETKYYKDARGLFLLAGPQISFVTITGGASNYLKKNYSIIAGGEFHINRIYFFIYRQTGLTEIYPSKTSVRLNGVTAGIGIPLL